MNLRPAWSTYCGQDSQGCSEILSEEKAVEMAELRTGACGQGYLSAFGIPEREKGETTPTDYPLEFLVFPFPHTHIRDKKNK